MPPNPMENPRPKSGRPRLLLCGHTYAVAVNRAKASALAEWFEVKVCAPDLRGIVIFGQQGETFDTDDTPADYSYERLPRWPRNLGLVRFFLKGLGRVMTRWRPDYVLCEAEPWSFLRWQAWALTRWRARGAKFVEFTWENVRRPGLKGLVLDGFYRAVAAGSDGVICGNRKAEGFLKQAGMPADRLLVTGQLGIGEAEHPVVGAEERRRWRVVHGFPAEARVVGYCGRWVREKGILELIEAVEQARERHTDLALAVMGSGDLKEELKAAAARFPWLKLLPPVPNSAVGRVIGHFDLMVLPSKPQLDPATGQLWEEQFGHILLESMMCGVPTLGSRSGAIPEVLEREDVLFEPGSVSSLRDLLLKWLAEPGALGNLGASQRQATLEKWSHRTLAGTYATFLLSLE